MPYLSDKMSFSAWRATSLLMLCFMVLFLAAGCSTTQTAEDTNSADDSGDDAIILETYVLGSEDGSSQSANGDDSSGEEEEEEIVQKYDDLYGALAFSVSNRNWSGVRNMDDPAQARELVAANCGISCEVHLVFGPGQCGTFAFGRAGWAVGVGLGRNAEEAAKTASKDCLRQGGRACQVVQPICNTVREEEDSEQES
jgi:hypothetical protein